MGYRMKKIYLTSILFFITVLSVSAQIKTTFTKEKRPANFLPTGLAEAKTKQIKNKVDVDVPAITRGIERYEKTNVYGQIIPDDFLFYRGLLSEPQQVIYDQMYKTLMNGEDFFETQAKINESEFIEVIDAVRYDNPEIFWWNGSVSWWYNSDKIITAAQMDFWLDQSELQSAYNKFWEMTAPVIYYANLLPDEMSKIKYIHDFICLSTEYDYESFNSNNYGGVLQTAYSCAVNYLTVCAGYSSCFQYYMQQLGIPCASLWGDGHQWNFIKVNDQYYQMDVTWNDTLPIPAYYNLKHEEMQKVNMHTPANLANKIIQKYPSTSDSMTYINYHGLLLEGSPYKYQELNYFDYSVEVQKNATVYIEEPRIIKNIFSISDFTKLLTENIIATNDNHINFYFSTIGFELFNNIVSSMTNEDSILEEVHKLRTDTSGFDYNFKYNSIQDYTILDFYLDFY